MVTVDKSYQLLACKYMSRQLDKLMREMDQARKAQDIEHVHQARVASRRLRAAFNVFQECFSSQQMKKWQKRIKRLTKRLGDARDTDVQIEFVSEFMSELTREQKAFKPGVKRLLLRLIQHRKSIQPSVIKTIDKIDNSTVLADIHVSIEKVLFLLRRLNIETASTYVFEQAVVNIHRCVEELFSHENSLANPDDIHNHHDMRIAAKRLRYTMEIYNQPYEGGLDENIAAVKKIQKLLGNIHDCDVWQEKINDFVKDEYKYTKEYYGHTRSFNRLKPGLDFLRDNRQRTRNELFEQLGQYWLELKEKDFWNQMFDSLHKPLECKEPALQPDNAVNVINE